MLVRDAGETSIESRNPSRRSSMIEIVENIAENSTVKTNAPAKKRPRSPEPEPINSQNTRGDATTPSTRLFCLQKRTNSRCHSVTTGNQKPLTAWRAAGRTGEDVPALWPRESAPQEVPEELLNQSSSLADKHVFQSRLMQLDRIDRAGESLHHLGDEAVAIGDFHAEHAVHQRRLQTEAGFDPAGQIGRVCPLRRLQHHDISADARTQVRGRALGHHATLMQ